MEPVLIATDALHADKCAITSFTLDMVIGHDRQDFTACFEPVEGVGGGSLLYIDGTEFGGIVDDVTTSTETGLNEYHGRTWDGILAAKRILPPNDSAYRTVSGEANSILASLITLVDLNDVFTASTENSGITVNYQFTRFVDAYTGIYKMLKSANAKLIMRRGVGKTVLSAVAAQTITNEVDSDLIDFTLTKTNRTVNHLVCAGSGEGVEREILHLYADSSGNVSTTQTLFGVDEIADYYDYNNADYSELLSGGADKLKEYQTKGAVDVTNIGRGSWDIGDTIQARDNKSGFVVNAPIVGKTIKVSQSTNWELAVSYEVGEVSRTAAQISGQVEEPEKVNRDGDTMTGDLIVHDTVTASDASQDHFVIMNWSHSARPDMMSCICQQDNSLDSRRGSAIPQERTWYLGQYQNDKWGFATGYSELCKETDGNIYRSFAVQRLDSNGENPIANGLYLEIRDSGERSVWVTEKKPWWKAFAPDVLYNNSSGTNGTVTLSASAANYNHMRIYTRTNDGNYQAYTAYSPNGNNVTLSVANANSSDVWVKTVMVTVSGTSIAPISTKYAECPANGSQARQANANTYIIRVEAWNE